MSAIRNSCVARGALPSSTNTLVYTVPTASSFLLKNLIVTTTGGTITGVYILLRSADASVNVYLAANSPYSGGTFVWSGWTAMNAGDGIVLNAVGAAANYWVSGAVLPFLP